MSVPTRSLGKPFADQLGLVRRGVVDDDVDVEIIGNVLLDEVEEAPKLPGAVTRQTFANDLAGGDVERRKQGGGAVPLVVVRVPLGLAGAHGQQRLGSVQRLDLRLLVDAEHQGAVGRVGVETDDIADLLHKERIGDS